MPVSPRLRRLADARGHRNSQRILDFDPTSGTLTLLSSQTVPIAEHVAGKVMGRVVVAGGDFNPTNVQAIRNDTVTTLTPLPDVSDDAVGAVIKGKVYIAGGHNSVNNVLPPPSSSARRFHDAPSLIHHPSPCSCLGGQGDGAVTMAACPSAAQVS